MVLLCGPYLPMLRACLLPRKYVQFSGCEFQRCTICTCCKLLCDKVFIFYHSQSQKSSALYKKSRSLPTFRNLYSSTETVNRRKKLLRVFLFHPINSNRYELWCKCIIVTYLEQKLCFVITLVITKSNRHNNIIFLKLCPWEKLKPKTPSWELYQHGRNHTDQ